MVPRAVDRGAPTAWSTCRGGRSENGRLNIAKDPPPAGALVGELRALQVRFTAGGRGTYAASNRVRSGANDLPPEIAEQAIHSYLDDHYQRALDDPLPILDGKTPRQAVKTKKGRAQVVDWLKLLENTESRRAAGQGHKPYDMAWMWRTLKIEEAR